ncbi:programmed cell death protein 2-like isoform X2 [Brachyhypopomus gauderio]|uniref:programmed cell death protein 2-like isoform X2 n=1 Tax=Brachyhypopomus gauderio TaxID=698409 RepID=UPI0040426712
MQAAMQESTLIGICDGGIDMKKGGTFYYTNKIGGSPDLIPGITDQCNRCILCDGILGHVVQIYCPLGESPYHRTLNIFACVNPQCYGKPESWKVLRSQCLESDLKQLSECQDASNLQVKQVQMSTTEWCAGADDWGMEAENHEPQSCAQTPADTAQKASGSAPAELDVSSRLKGLCLDVLGSKEATTLPPTAPAFQPFYISVVEEKDLVAHKDMEHAYRLLKEYEEREGVTVEENSSNEAEGVESYEKTEAKHGDAVFSRFMKRISLCPEQVLRYNWSGSPLLLMKPPSILKQIVPACAHCGSPRVFEFQLMPALVSLLHNTDPSSELVLEFGTVLVYTCRESCWMSGSNVPVEEFIFVQADPDQKLFK